VFDYHCVTKSNRDFCIFTGQQCIDIYFLLQNYTVGEMIEFYKKKYSQFNEANVVKSLCWFEDVDLSDWPVLIKTPKLKWETVMKTITEATSQYLKQL